MCSGDRRPPVTTVGDDSTSRGGRRTPHPVRTATAAVRQGSQPTTTSLRTPCLVQLETPWQISLYPSKLKGNVQARTVRPSQSEGMVRAGSAFRGRHNTLRARGKRTAWPAGWRRRPVVDGPPGPLEWGHRNPGGTSTCDTYETRTEPHAEGAVAEIGQAAHEPATAGSRRTPRLARRMASRRHPVPPGWPEEGARAGTTLLQARAKTGLRSDSCDSLRPARAPDRAGGLP